MTFNPIAAKSVYKCKNLIKSNNLKAIDLGSQTSSIDPKFLNYLVNDQKIDSNILLDRFNDLKFQENFSTRDYFMALGFEDYLSIDINGAYKSFEFDLNVDIRNTYNFYEQYDLVINNGTGEHVFNQANLYLNFHNLTKKNGIMLNIVPFIDWINHGFYNYNPIFFADLAASNGYEVINISLANRNAGELELPKEKLKILYEQIKPNKKETQFRRIIDTAKTQLGENILIVSVCRKIFDNEFKFPLQGKYLDDVKDKNLEYNSQDTGSAGAEGQIADNNKR